MTRRFLKRWLLSGPIVGLTLMLLMPCTIQAEDIYDQVKADIRAERTQMALKTLRGMVKKRPDDFHAWFLFGVANAHLNQYHQAIEAFRHVIELNPKLAEPHDNLAVIYNELGDVPAAVHELEQSLIKRPDNPVAEENLADLYVKMALKHYRGALEREPTSQLEQRYMRLLQVRDPDVASHQQKEQSKVSMPVEMTQNRHDVAADGHGDVQPKPPEPVHPEAVVSEPAIENAIVEETVAVAVEPVAEVVALTSPAQSEMAKQSLESQVLDAVEAWRAAWSSQSLPDYFAAYAEGFEVPERFKSTEEWQAYKRRVISSKSYIEIEISDLQVELEADGKVAHVKFFQKFRSNSYNGAGAKVLKMRLDNGVWKILREDSVS